MSTQGDVIVIGGGIWGLSCAYSCAKRGLSVVVYEANEVGKGASGGIVGAMAPHVPESWSAIKQFQFEALNAAADYWAEIEKISDQATGYGRIGRLIPITSARDLELSHERSRNTKELWQGQFNWDVVQSHKMVPEVAAPFGLVYETLSARIYPRLAVSALAKACENLGVLIHPFKRVTGVDDNLVYGPWGQASAKAIIIAGGTEGFTLLDYHLGCETGSGVKGQAALLDVDLGDAPQLFANGVYVIPHQNGTTAVGSTSEKKWGQPFEIDGQLAELIKTAQHICPQLAGAAILQRWAGLRPKARRRHPMLGPVPSLNGVYSAMGAFTIGFGISHKVGEVLADMVMGCSVDIPKNFTVDWHVE